MQDLVSIQWTRAWGLAASVAVAFVIHASSGSTWMAWMSLAWVVVAISGSDLEGNPLPAVARVPSAAPTRTTVL